MPDDHLPPKPGQEKRRSINRPGWPKISPTTGRRQHTKDPDATEGWRTRNNGPGDEVFAGYDLHLIADTPSPDQPGATHFIRGMALRPAGTLKSHPGLAALRGYMEGNGKPDHITGDRGYTYLKPANWANYILDLGIPTTIDLHGNQRGTKPGPFPGTIWVDGGLFIDSLPASMRELPAFTIGLSKQEKDDRADLYEARRPYLFENHGRPRPGRKQRIIGPAARGKVRCPNTPASMRLSPAKAPTTTCVKGQDCSCGKTLTLGPNDGPQLRQEHPFGTRKWVTSHNRRTAIERANALVKVQHGSVTRSTVRVIGQIKVALLLSFVVGCANLRCVRKNGWGDDVEPLIERLNLATDTPLTVGSDEDDMSGDDPPDNGNQPSQSSRA